MKKIVFLLVFLIGTIGFATAQEVVASGGGYEELSTISVSWTLGETFIATHETASAEIITEGFQQSRLTITAVEDLFELNVKILAYPNPVVDIVNLKINTTDYRLPTTNYSYSITDLSGRQLISGKFNSSIEPVNLSELPQGIYMLKVSNIENKHKVFKIIKK